MEVQCSRQRRTVAAAAAAAAACLQQQPGAGRRQFDVGQVENHVGHLLLVPRVSCGRGGKRAGWAGSCAALGGRAS